ATGRRQPVDRGRALPERVVQELTIVAHVKDIARALDDDLRSTGCNVERVHTERWTDVRHEIDGLPVVAPLHARLKRDEIGREPRVTDRGGKRDLCQPRASRRPRWIAILA